MEKLTTYTVFDGKGQEVVSLAFPANVDEDAILAALLNIPSIGLEGGLGNYTVEKDVVMGTETFLICDIVGNLVVSLREAGGTVFI